MTDSPIRSDAVAAVRSAVPGVQITDDAELVRRRSTDRSAMLGPLMASEVGGSLADAVAIPANENIVFDPSGDGLPGRGRINDTRVTR